MISTVFAIATVVAFRILKDWTPLEQLDHIDATNLAVLSATLLTLIALDWRPGMKASPDGVVTAGIVLLLIGSFTFTKTDGWAAIVGWFEDLPL